MVSIVYGGANSSTYSLSPSKKFIAVRTRSKRSLNAGPIARSELQVLSGFEICFSIPEAGVEIYERKSRDRALSTHAAKKALRGQADVRFAGSVLVDEDSQEPVLYTENLFIQFADNLHVANCQQTIAGAGLTVKRKIEYLHNAWFVSAPEGTGQEVFDTALNLVAQSDVVCCHPELIRRLGRREISDSQWHLKPTTINGTAITAGVNADKAQLTTLGAGTVIAIIDDGVDIDHPEFSGASKVVAPLDTQFGSNDPRPKFPSDNHGTACAGVACANGIAGAAGVATAARLMPIRHQSALGSQSEADAIAWAADQGADVISCSWGPRDGRWWDQADPLHNTVFPLPDSSRLAIEHATANGRQGKGCVIVWAAGNGNESVDNDGYASHPNVFAIAACNDTGKRCVYSDFGNAIFCAFPSGDSGWPAQSHPEPLTTGIWTTDRRHGAGYNEGILSKGDLAGQFTNSFSGTSSATPGAAGVAALILSLNPELHWQQVGDIMRRACDRIDPGNGHYQNGHSQWYGYGRINAETAVQLALPQPQTNSISITGQFMAPIEDNQTTTVSVAVSDQRKLESLTVEIDIQHSWIGDLTVSLIPPGSHPIVLHNQEGANRQNIQRQYDAMLVPAFANLLGQTVSGEWQLQVSDHARQDQGFIKQFSINLAFEDNNTRKVLNTRSTSRDSQKTAQKKTKTKKKSAVGKKTTSKKAGATRKKATGKKKGTAKKTSARRKTGAGKKKRASTTRKKSASKR